MPRLGSIPAASTILTASLAHAGEAVFLCLQMFEQDGVWEDAESTSGFLSVDRGDVVDFSGPD
jgi:hypothetical protein